jgi:hypothetical protein
MNFFTLEGENGAVDDGGNAEDCASSMLSESKHTTRRNAFLVHIRTDITLE